MCYLDNSSQPSEVYVIFYSKCYKQRKCALPWVTPLSNRACIMLVTVFFFFIIIVFVYIMSFPAHVWEGVDRDGRLNWGWRYYPELSSGPT